MLTLPSLIVTVLLGQGSPAPSAGEFLPKYRAALTSLEERFGEMRAEGEWSEVLDKPGWPKPKRDRRYRLTYAASGGRYLASRVLLSDEGKPAESYFEQLFLYNLPRVVTLERYSPEADYLVEKAAGPDESRDESMSVNVNRFFRAPFATGLGPNRELIDSGRLTITRVTALDRDGERLLRADFDYRPTEPRAKRLLGYWVVAPDRGWVLREYRVEPQAADAAVTTGTIEYQSGAGPIPDPANVSVSIRSKNGFESRNSISFTSIEHVATPAAEFGLAAYGLGDYEQMLQPSGTRYGPFLFFLAFAGVALVVSLVFRRYAKKAAAA